MTFNYPPPRSSRRHGPAGYADLQSYRPWLRDDFDFRCVYCMNRETWGRMTGDFEIDHFQPQKLAPQSRLDYDNLVYACRRCNLVKSAQSIDDPVCLLDAEKIVTRPDGTLYAELAEVRRLILQLDLNSPRLCSWRVMWMRIVQLAETADPALHENLVGLPHDLPDLKRLRPPTNSRPEGLQQCWLEKQKTLNR